MVSDSRLQTSAWRALFELCPYCLRSGVQGRTWQSALTYASEERHCTRCHRFWWTDDLPP
jgi:hypothetical protein